MGARLLTLAVGLFMTPYLLDRLGADRFAVWALASIATGSLGRLDLGVRRALIQRIAAKFARTGSGSLSSLLSSALALCAGLAVLALLRGCRRRVTSRPPCALQNSSGTTSERFDSSLSPARRCSPSSPSPPSN